MSNRSEVIKARNPGVLSGIHELSKAKAARYLAAGAIAVGGVGVALHKAGEHIDPFATNIPVPAANMPHRTHIVQYGETEASIVESVGHPNDYNLINMLNEQLPKEDQAHRILRPGEALLLPLDQDK